MKLAKINTQGFCVLNIEGRINSANFNLLESEINEILAQGQINIVLNCKDLNYISSSGLRVFLIAQKKLMAVKGKLHLCEMQSGIKEIFDISGFTGIFKIFDTEKQALEAS